MKKNYATLILVVVILLVFALVAHELHLRLDLTDDRQYTLSQATVNILEQLEDPVTVKAYFSENMPPSVMKTRQDFQEMLIEYANASDGMLVYEFINPSENETLKQEAINSGIRPISINVREKDQMKQQTAFLGATVVLGEKTDVIPFMQPGTAMEYALSTSIKKITVTEKSLLGFLQGHGEPPLTEMLQLQTQLSILYQPEEINLEEKDIPSRMRTLVVVRPTDTIPSSTLAKLDNFMTRGGSLAIAMNRVSGDLQNASGTLLSTGLETWLQQRGVVVEANFVTDASCGSITAIQRQGVFTMRSAVAFPYMPRLTNFADHPITKGLENVLFEFASSIRYAGDTTKIFTPIVMTSQKSNTSSPPLYFDISKQWVDQDFPLSNLTVGAVLEEKNNNDDTSSAKIVVISDGDFVVNGEQQQARDLQPDNISLLSNAIDWLADDTGLIELRTKGVTSRPIDELEDGAKTTLKYANFLAPILLVLLYGLYRMQRNKMKRLRRASENYDEV